MTKRRSLIGAAVITAVVILVGGIAAYVYFRVLPGQRAADPISSAKVVPDQAWMAGYVSADVNSWSKLKQFGNAEAQDLVAKGLGQFTENVDEGLGKYNLTYEQDFQPWLGSAMFALLPAAAGSAESAEPGVLVVVGIKDKVAALNFFNKMKNREEVKTTQSKYKGVDLIEVKEGVETPTYLAVLEDHIALAPQQNIVEQAIDTFKGEPSLATQAAATQALSKVTDFETPIAQFYMPNYAEGVKQFLEANPGAAPLPLEALDQFKQIESMAVGVGIDSAGIRIKMAAKVNPDQFKWEYKPVPGQVVAQFPAETIALISGGGIDRQWSLVVEQLQKTNPDLRQGLDDFRQQFRQQTQLDLDKDIFGWMDGDYALGFLPSQQGITATVGFGAAVVMDTSDRTTAEAALGKLDTLAKNNRLSVGSGQVGTVSLTEWKVPNQETILGHGWLDQDTVVLAIGGRTVAEAVTTKPSQSLKDSEAFQTITRSLPQPNAGYFFLDMDKTLALLKNNATLTQGAGVPTETEAILSSIRGIGMTTTQGDGRSPVGDHRDWVQWEGLIALKSKS